MKFGLVRDWKWYINIFSPLMDVMPRVGFSVVMSLSPSFCSGISWLIARVLGQFCFSQILLQKLLCLSLLGFVLHLKHHTMSKHRGTFHRAASGCSHSQRAMQVTKVDGYNNDISLQVQSVIDDWEERLVNENLARDINGGSPNHYWIIKNMIGSLMEEILEIWNDTKLAIS